MYRDYVRPIFRNSSARTTAFCADQANGLNPALMCRLLLTSAEETSADAALGLRRQQADEDHHGERYHL
jgi:hypothetical protein